MDKQQTPLGYAIVKRFEELRDAGAVPLRIQISIPAYYVLKMERDLPRWKWARHSETFHGLPVEVFGRSPANNPTPDEWLNADAAAKDTQIIAAVAGRTFESFCVGAEQ
jgi:hypothetical protein